MSIIAQTPKPPYYAVIFTSIRTDIDEGYAQMAEKMVQLAATQPGFLGMESARDGLGITVSYWGPSRRLNTGKPTLNINKRSSLAMKNGIAALKPASVK
jgi:hypothetical protein